MTTHPTIDPERLRELLAIISLGPWRYEKANSLAPDTHPYAVHGAPNYGRLAMVTDEEDAALIALTPDLARAYLALHERIGRMEEAMKSLVEYAGYIASGVLRDADELAANELTEAVEDARAALQEPEHGK